jgi:predicted Zn-dependent protease
VNANDGSRAEQVLKEAIAADSHNVYAYRTLALGVYANSGRLLDAERVIRQGISAGAPAVPMYETLADAEISQHNFAAAAAALEKAEALAPSDFDLARMLGQVYMSDNKLNRAAVWLRKATRLNPQSAPAFFDLAQAEEANYQFFAAERAYTQALALDASNTGYRARYAEFKRKVAEASSH